MCTVPICQLLSYCRIDLLYSSSSDVLAGYRSSTGYIEYSRGNLARSKDVLVDKNFHLTAE